MATDISTLALVNDWVAHHTRLQELTTALERLRADVETCTIRVGDDAKELRKLVGSNVFQRLFNVGDGRVVLVSHAKGVELVTLEDAAPTPTTPSTRVTDHGQTK